MTSIEKAFAITGAFEGGRGYATLAGNRDKQGISWGMFQWNFGQGTLQRLLLDCYANGPQTFRRCCTQHVDVYGRTMDLADELLRVCRLPAAAAVAWAAARQDRRFQLLAHWRKAFDALAAEPGFQAVQRKHAKPYMDRAFRYMAAYGFKSERALCLLFDITIQMGSIGAGARERYRDALAAGGPSMTEQAKLIALAKAIAPQGGPWAHDVLSRKGTIASGRGTVHGRVYDLARDFGLGDGPVV